MKTYTVILQEAENGDLMLPIPQEILDTQGWQEGDFLQFRDNGKGTWTLSSLNPPEPAIDDMLMALLGSKDFVDAWWTSPNAHFEFRNPEDCDREQVYQYVLKHCSL